MAGVFINIPGVGNVEAQGAASEATLRELLSVMRGGGGGRGGAGGGGAGGGGGGGGGGGMSPLGLAGAVVGKAFNKLGVVAGFTTGVIGKLAGGAMKATSAAIGLGESITDAVKSLSQLDGSATSVANIFRSVPLIGPVFAAVAGAADDVVRSYQAVAQTGATFGGSISNFATAASQAGMSMAEFGSMIQKNGNAMTAFGTTTEGGASNFARVSKQLRSTSSELYALGFSTQDINQGLASYGALMKSQGLQGKKSNAELAQGAKTYLKEMDALAKATGQSRAQVEESMAAMAKDAQFQASMSGLGEGVRNSFLAVTGGLPKGLETFAKDIMSTGTATTEENQKLMAMMPQSAAMLQRMNQKMQRGEAVTLEERNALNNLMKQEGAKNLQNIKYAGAASAELGGTVNALAATQQINADGLKQATEEQKKAAAETDKMNQKMQQFQSAIAEVSNNFKMLLANSGVLDVLIQAFHGLVGLANQYLVPAFNIVASVVMKVANGIGILLQPALDYLGEKFGASGLGGTVEFIDGIMNAVFPILGGIVRGAILAFDGLYAGVMSIITPLKDLMTNIFGVSDSANGFGEILIEVGAYVGEVLQYLGKAIGVVIRAIDFFLTPVIHVLVDVFKGVWFVIKKVIDGFAGLMDLFEDFADFMSGVMDMILRGVNKLTLGATGISEEEFERNKKARDESKKAREEERKRRDNDKSRNEEAIQTQKAGLNQDSKKFKEQKLTHERLTAGAKREAAAKEAAVKAQEKLLDYSAGPEELLKQFSSKQGGAVEIGIKKGEISKEKEAADKELAAAKTGAEKKAAAEKIEAAEAKLKALSEAEALAKQRTGSAPASANADATRKQIEADAAKKTADEAAAKKKAEDEAAAKKKAEEDVNKKKEEDTKKPQSSETLLAELNTQMATLLKYTWTVANNTNETVNATRSLNGNLYKA